MTNSINDLVDVAYYNGLAGTNFADAQAVIEDCKKYSLEKSFPVNRHFVPEWYVWQNPDVHQFNTVIEHFWTVGDRRIIDPSPFVDMTLFCRKNGVTTSKDGLFALLNGAHTEVSEGVHSSFETLKTHQQKFLTTIRPDLLFDKRATKETDRKRLVWLQIGPRSEFADWFKRNQDRSWDLMTNWYEFSAIDLSLGEMSVAQRGTKFTAVAKVVEHYPELFAKYDQILFLDDDLIFEFEHIDRLFDLADANNADLFQAGLTKESHCVWPVLKETSGKDFRPLNTVEIMMPGFSRQGFEAVKQVFKHSVSGFGLDFAMGAIAHQKEFNVGIIDPIRARHLKPINQSVGAYYEFLRAAGINSKLELWYLMQEFKTDNEIKAI